MAAAPALKVAFLVLACVLIAAPHADAAISCGQVLSGLVPCLGYLRGGPLAPACCPGVKGLNAAAKTTPDRRAACGCLKQIFTSTPGLSIRAASTLPGKCGVNVGYPISLSVDCSKVQ